MLVKMIFIGRLSSVNVFWLIQSVLLESLCVIAISLLGQNQKGELAGHLLSSLTTYKYPEHDPSVLEVVDIQKFQHFQALTHINLDLKAGEFVSFWDLQGAVKPHCYA